MGWLSTLSKAAALLAAAELGAGLGRAAERRERYALARAEADRLGRALVVVGDPDSGAWTRWLGRAYECGDVCIDLHGCPKCPSQIEADITKGIDLPSNSSVVFVACVLEYVDDIQAAWREILRVAGDASRVFVVRVHPWTLTAHFFPGAKWLITEHPPESPRLVAKRISSDPRDGSRLAGPMAGVEVYVG